MGTTAVSNFTVRLGPFAVAGKLSSLTKPNKDKDSKFKMITPDSHKLVEQFYRGVGEDKLWKQGELHRGKVIGDKVIPVDKEEIEAAKTSELPLNLIALSVHPAEQAAQQMWHADSSYMFEPHQADDYYGTLFALVSNPEHCFVGVACIKEGTREGLFRVTVHGNGLIFEKMLYPEDMEINETPTVDVDQELLDMGSKMVEGMVADFDPQAYPNTVKERLAALTGDTSIGTPIPIKAKQQKADLKADLKAFIEAQPKKAVAKKAPAVKKQAKKSA